MNLLLACVAWFALLHSILGAPHSRCRCLPGDACWPSLDEWNKLNASIANNLLISFPLAQSCHDPYYNEQVCAFVHQNWQNGVWRTSQPYGLFQTTFEVLNNETWSCQLNATRSSACTLGNLPVYIVNASSTDDIQKAVTFAADHNLRLSIKNTGHDYLGRNTAAGSLSIWTHRLNQIQLFDNFVTNDPSANGSTAVTVQSGVQMAQLYKAVAAKNWVVVGGAANTVGVGGYVGGGGHSAISPNYGLAVDNALEFTLVLPSGEVIVANGAQYSDIFWALRGGGASTWGVVIDVTFRTYPGPSVLSYAEFGAYTTNTTLYKMLLEKFVKEQPAISEGGFGGYWYNSNDTLLFLYANLNTNKTQAAKVLEPFVNYTASIGAEYQLNMTEYNNWNSWYLDFACPGGDCGSVSGGSAFLSSRLIPRENFERPGELADALINAYNAISGTGGTIGHLVAGGEVSKKDPDSVAVNPAWRKALWHIVISVGYEDNAPPAEREKKHKLTTKTNEFFRDITPGSGCYMNEADIYEPNWQQAFFGSHYDRLVQIKRDIDPDHLFICRNCIGSDEWDESLNCRK